MDRRTLVTNIVAVAKTAKLYGLPIVLSSVNVKTGANQPTIHQLTDVLEGIEAFDRTTINAWEDEEFVQAVGATDRKKLLMAALWTEACLSFPRSTQSGRGTRFIPLWMRSAVHRSRRTAQRWSVSSKLVHDRRAGFRSCASCSGIGRVERPRSHSRKMAGRPLQDLGPRCG